MGEKIESSCSTVLCVDASRQFIKTGDRANISKGGPCMVTQNAGGTNVTLTNITVDGSSSSPVYAEFKVGDDVPVQDMCIGAVVQKPELDLGMCRSNGNDDEAYFMHLGDSGLYGSGKDGDDYQGERIAIGDRVGVLVKTGAEGFIRFFRNGNEYGPGYRVGDVIDDYDNDL